MTEQMLLCINNFGQSFACLKEPNLFVFPGFPFPDAAEIFSPPSFCRIVTAMSIGEDCFEKQSPHLLSLLNSVK